MTHPSPRAPRSPQQRSADSRARILRAAVDCLVEGGYSGATTLRIQARAGVSRGRLTHHFPSRDRLLVAAAQHLAQTRLRLTEDRFDEVAGELAGADRLDRAIEVMWHTFQEPHFWAALELWTASRTNPGLQQALLPEVRELGEAIKAVVDRIYGPPYTAHPRYVQVRDVLFTSMRGVALMYAFDPRDPAADPNLAHWKDLARTLLA